MIGVLARLMYAVTFLAGLGASLNVFQMLISGDSMSAPQQGGLAAMTATMVIVPYCMARALEGLAPSSGDREDNPPKRRRAKKKVIKRPANYDPLAKRPKTSDPLGVRPVSYDPLAE